MYLIFHQLLRRSRYYQSGQMRKIKAREYIWPKDTQLVSDQENRNEHLLPLNDLQACQAHQHLNLESYLHPSLHLLPPAQGSAVHLA